MNITRRIEKSLFFGMIGFLIPIVLFGLIAICIFTFVDIHPNDRQQDIQNLPATILIPAVGCAFIFALAGFAADESKSGISFIRSLMIVSSAILIAVIATAPRVRTKRIDPKAWIEVVVPIGIGILTSLVIVVYNHKKRRSNHAD